MTTLMNQLQARIETAVNKTGTYNEALQNLANLFSVPQGETGSRLIPVAQAFNPTINNATAAQNYLLYNSSLVSGGVPSLGLDFTSGMLDSRITFTRASNATVVNSAGLVSYAPHNLLTNSESFEAAAWVKSTGTITANAATAPDGTTTADKFINATTSNSTKHVSQTVGSTIGTFSVYAKAAEESVISLWLVGASVGAAFDLAAGTTVLQGATSSSITAVGNGWYRCAVYQNTATTTAHIYMRTGSAFVGNALDGVFLWGAELNEGPLQPYYFTTPKNLLGFTQEFDNAAWTKTTATVTANAVSAPDGTTSADLIIPNAGVVGTVAQTTITITSATPYVYSVYAKAGGFNWLRFQINGITGTRVAWFNLASGVTGTVQSLLTAAISSVGNGWYRCSVAFTSDNTTGSVSFVPTTSDNSTANGDGTSGVYLWGAQASNSASVDPYVYNPGAAPTSTAYYGPRFDYDPVTLAPKGLLIEEQRTNLLTYSEDFSNAIWVKTNSSITADVIVTPNNTLTGDKLVEDATTNLHQVYQNFVGAVAPYTFSVYAKAGERTVVTLLHGSGNSADYDLVAGTATGTGASIVPVGNGWYRCIITQTLPDTLNRSYAVRLNNGSGVTYAGNGTSGAFIWGAQLEAGSFATSYIPTVAAQVTRSADNASMTGTNFSSWYNATEGTLLADVNVVTNGAPNNLGVLAMVGATNNDRILIYQNGSASAYSGQMVVAGVPQLQNDYLNEVSGVNKFSFAYKLNDSNIACNGSALSTDTTCTVPTCQSLVIGSGPFLTPLNGYVRRIVYYNTRLTNAQLQALTS